MSETGSEYDFDDVAESATLLGDDAGEAERVEEPAFDAAPKKLKGAWYQAKSPGVVVGLISFILFCLVLSATLALIPMVRLMEDVVCRQYYGTDEPVEEKLCKTDEIQAELAWLGGISGVVNAIIGLTVSFPWGMLSDKVGRKPIFRLSYFGIILQFFWCFLVIYRSDIFPIRAVLAAPALNLVGGGLGVAIAVIHSIVADVTTERASGFIWCGVGAVLGSIIGPAMAATLMEHVSPWIPMLVPLFILTPIVYLTTIFIPETLPSKPQRKTSSSRKRSFGRAFKAHLDDSWKRLRESLALFKSRSVILLLLTFVAHEAIQIGHNQILLQSISKRFGWKLAQTGYLMSIRGIITIVVMVALPMISMLLVSEARLGKYHLSLFRKDLVLAQFSAACLIVGSLLMGGQTIGEMLAGVVVSTLSVGLGSMTKSLVANYVDAEHTSRLYVLTGMIETVGGLFAGPTLAWAFQAGMRLGGRWIGLPFFYLAVLSGLVFGSLFFVRQPDVKKVDEEETDSDGVLGHGTDI